MNQLYLLKTGFMTGPVRNPSYPLSIAFAYTASDFSTAYLVISNSLLCHQMNTLQDSKQKMNRVEETPQQNTPHNKPNIEDDELIKSLHLRDINSKYSDL